MIDYLTGLVIMFLLVDLIAQFLYADLREGDGCCDHMECGTFCSKEDDGPVHDQ